jgi:hypothetical protein
VKCGYLERSKGATIYREYNAIIAMLVNMVRHIDDWKL